MAADLETARRKLRDIEAAARRGVHRPELLVAARDEAERLRDLLQPSADGTRRTLEQLIARYEALMFRLTD